MAQVPPHTTQPAKPDDEKNKQRKFPTAEDPTQPAYSPENPPPEIPTPYYGPPQKKPEDAKP